MGHVYRFISGMSSLYVQNMIPVPFHLFQVRKYDEKHIRKPSSRFPRQWARHNIEEELFSNNILKRLQEIQCCRQTLDPKFNGTHCSVQVRTIARASADSGQMITTSELLSSRSRRMALSSQVQKVQSALSIIDQIEILGL